MKLMLLVVTALMFVSTPAIADLYSGPIYQNGKVWQPSSENDDLGLGYWLPNPNAATDEGRAKKETEKMKKLLDTVKPKE